MADANQHAYQKRLALNDWLESMTIMPAATRSREGASKTVKLKLVFVWKISVIVTVKNSEVSTATGVKSLNKLLRIRIG